MQIFIRDSYRIFRQEGWGEGGNYYYYYDNNIISLATWSHIHSYSILLVIVTDTLCFRVAVISELKPN